MQNTAHLQATKTISKLFIIRGLPGSGKTITAKRLLLKHMVNSIHQTNNINSKNIQVARQQLLQLVRKDLKSNKSVAACDTFTELWEIIPLLKLAKQLYKPTTIIDLYDQNLTNLQLAQRDLYGVTQLQISEMRHRWQTQQQLMLPEYINYIYYTVGDGTTTRQPQHTH